MSNSKTLVTVQIADQQGELEVFDGGFRVVERGFGSLRAELDPGLYKVRARAGSVQTDRLFAVERGAAALTVTLGPLRFPSPVPLRDAAASQNGPESVPIAVPGGVPADVGLGQGASLFLSFRVPSDARLVPTSAAATSAPTNRRALAGFRLRRATGELLLDFAQADLGAPSRELAVVDIALQPGPYILSHEPQGREAVAMPVMAVEGWRSQMFMEIDLPRGELEPGRPNLSDRAVVLARLAGPCPADDRYLRLAEMARYALIQGRQVLTHEQLAALLNEKFENPVLGLFAAHLLLLETPANCDLLSAVIQNVAGMIGEDFPDLIALRMALAERRGVQAEFPRDGLPFPPLLRPSWNLLAAHAELLPAGSLARNVASRLVSQGPWLAWQPFDPVDQVLVPGTDVERRFHVPGELVKTLGRAASWVAHAAESWMSAPWGHMMALPEEGGGEPATGSTSSPPADEAAAALALVTKLALELPWSDIAKHLETEANARRLTARLTSLQKSLLPTLQLIREQSERGDDFTREELEQLCDGHRVSPPVLRDSLEDLAKKLLALVWR